MEEAEGVNLRIASEQPTLVTISVLNTEEVNDASGRVAARVQSARQTSALLTEAAEDVRSVTAPKELQREACA